MKMAKSELPSIRQRRLNRWGPKLRHLTLRPIVPATDQRTRVDNAPLAFSSPQTDRIQILKLK